MKRRQVAHLGRETLAILQAGQYTAPSGRAVSVRDALTQSRHGTCTYRPTDRLPTALAGEHPTQYAVVNESTLEAARRLQAAGHRVAALNFASAKNPGGGFLGGAQAQEESLARASGLYACLVNNEMYAYHRSQGDCLYSGYAIYSPDVPVFRDDEGALLEQPWPCSFVTCPAVNVGALRQKHQARGDAVTDAMQERVGRVLTIAARHGHEAIVLGAWGCGVFRNDAEEIAGLFRSALTLRFRGVFRELVFAVLDTSTEQRFIGPFARAFR